MQRTHILGLLFAVVVFGSVDSSLDLRMPSVPPFGSIVNRITNTTLGIVRGGINIFSRTLDRIINTVGSIEDRLRALLEELRRQIILGIPELSIPILDPLHVDKIDFDVNHEAAELRGSVENVSIRYISKFVTDKVQFIDLGKMTYKVHMNLTFPRIRIDGYYDLNGTFGNTFSVFGNGDFWLDMIQFKLATTAVIRFRYPRLRMTALSINVKLKALENQFDNFMGDEELGELFNKVISRVAPEALDMFWPGLKKPIEREIMAYINDILANATISNLVKRLFNIIT